MASLTSDKPTLEKPLRLWPGVVAVVLQWVVRFGVPAVEPDAMLYGVFGGFIGGLVVLVWWVFWSRAPWSERLLAVALMTVALVATPPLLHESIATAAQGMVFFILVVPVLSLAFVGWAVVSRRLSGGLRRASMAAAILLACGGWTLVRTGGFTGNFDNDLNWRWTETPEERLLAHADAEPMVPAPAPEAAETAEEPPPIVAGDQPASPPAAPAAAEDFEKQLTSQSGVEPTALPADPVTAGAEAEWPGFRGPTRDGVIPGVRIETDWAAAPPVELWRRPIGPGWSSFAVQGDLFYTQEQRGEDEIVACYRLTTGEPVWRHRDPARFWESNGGAGPRATPTLRGGRVYTFGATGILNVLDALNGAVLWSRNVASDSGTEVPGWGFASSPLLVGDAVIVAAGGKLAAYDLANGDPRWFGEARGDGYSSPHLLTIDGVPQILLVSGSGASSVAPADGKLLWEYRSSGDGIVQPALTADGDILIGSGSQNGMRRLAVAHGPGGWTVEERWSSTGLKPYFNDFVVHEGHAFGFDGSILSCIDLEDGKRKWKGGRYGHGQLVLLPDQDLLLLVSERGELALVAATFEGFRELARFAAIEGKTWNHPVLVRDLLLARNGEEMAAFRLSLFSR